VLEKNSTWTCPLDFSNGKVISREVGIDVWDVRTVQLKQNGIDFEKLV
jgi:hypothetical protein